MAGIGFHLKKILSQDSFSSTLKAYAYSALISSGPLLMTIGVIFSINWMSIESLTSRELAYLKTLVTYGFALSLVAVGPGYMAITRYLADEYYRKHTASYTAAYFSCLALHALFFGPLVFLYFSFLSVSIQVKIAALLLFLFALGTWIAMLFLSAARDYMRILLAFFAGSVASVALAYFLGKGKGMAEYFTGFVCGQGVTFLVLSVAIVREFGYKEARDYYWLGTFRKYPFLCAMGFFYNLGIWIDKFVFWLSPESTVLDAGLRYSHIYDGPMFFAYLTVVPSMAYFLIQMETDFFFKYSGYYRGIQNQESLESLERRRLRMVESLEENFKRLILFQGMISGLSLLAVPWLVRIARLEYLHMGVLRAGILGSYLLVAYLIVLLILLYFDCQREAFFCSFFFCLTNALFTAASIRMGLAAYGFGFAASCFVSLIAAFYFLNRRLYLLHYWTFMRQPLPKQIPVVEE